MILSDRDIRAAISAGHVSIEPFDDRDVQPSSVDLHVDRFFRTFHNARHPYIDVKTPMDDLTEVIEVKEEEAFILHPGEFVLGSTAEYVKLPHDLVARLEGKSSLGRLGLLIHSSLPGDEPVLFLQEGVLATVPIRDIVLKGLQGAVVSFDPATFEVGYHEVTGTFEGAPDRIFEVRLASGRRVHVTGGHNLFSVDRDGDLLKLRVHELTVGNKVAVPGRIPDQPDIRDPFDVPVLVGAGGSPSMLLQERREMRRGTSQRPREVPVTAGPDSLAKLDRLVDSDLQWDTVVEVRDTGRVEPVFDLEVRPDGRRIENFLAGYGGVFVSNTAGYVDPGFEGHLTLELSNVANLPITIYPNMKIGQISFFRLTSPAEHPYGSDKVRSKYQGQRGPTPSRYHENFEED